MRISIIALLALAGTAFAGPIDPTGCSNCILNTPTPQTAQINIGTETIRGTLTVSTISVTNLSIVTLTATNIVGNGSGITALNASQLGSGVVPNARLAGAYTGITGVGTIAAGVWQGTMVAPQYGGTGQNWNAVGRGGIPFFDGTGTMNVLPPGAVNRLLQTGGAGADPSWTATPSILGTNVTAIPMANLITGTLPAAITVTDASLLTVSGSKITGNISGNAANIIGTLPLAQLQAGTLAANIVAQNLIPSGVTAGTYGGPTQMTQVVVNNQGIITSAGQFPSPAILFSSTSVKSVSTSIGLLTTSSAAWAVVPGSQLGITISSPSYMRVQFNCNAECVNRTSCGVSFGYTVDGSFMDGATSSPLTGIMYLTTDNSQILRPTNAGIDHRSLTKITAGAHTLALLWSSTDGAQIQMGRNMLGCSIQYRQDPDEIFTGSSNGMGGGGGAPGITDYGVQSNSQLKLLACPALPCRAQSSTDFDIYTATANAAGSWRNTRTGYAPL